MKNQIKKLEFELQAIDQEEKKVFELIKTKEKQINAIEDEIELLIRDLENVARKYENKLQSIERLKGIYD